MKQLPKFNIVAIAVCVLIIVVGFALMTGDPSTDVYNPDIFSFRRITLGPMIALAGFVAMIIAIWFPGKKNDNNKNQQS